MFILSEASELAGPIHGVPPNPLVGEGGAGRCPLAPPLPPPMRASIVRSEARGRS